MVTNVIITAIFALDHREEMEFKASVFCGGIPLQNCGITEFAV